MKILKKRSPNIDNSVSINRIIQYLDLQRKSLIENNKIVEVKEEKIPIIKKEKTNIKKILDSISSPEIELAENEEDISAENDKDNGDNINWLL